MMIYTGTIYVTKIPPSFIKEGVKVIVNHKIEEIESVTGHGDNYLSLEYNLKGHSEPYYYSDLWVFVIEPNFKIGEDVNVWFEDKPVHISQITKTNYGYMVDNRYEYVSHTAIAIYIIPEFWDEALEHMLDYDIKFELSENTEKRNIPEFWNSKSVGYYAKLLIS